MNLRVLIVDDEPLARNRLQRLLRAEADVDVLQLCADGRTAVDAIRTHRPDLVFLDVQMPQMCGFDVVAEIGPHQMPAVVFVTAYDSFALQAFEAQALDYILKPFGEERVRVALARSRRFIAGAAPQSLQEQLAGLLRLRGSSTAASASVLVRKRDRILVLRANEIDWIEAYGDYVKLHVGAELHLLRATLSEMAQRLAPEGFARIHRSRLVNWDRVKEFTAEGEHVSEVVLKTGARLGASPGYLKNLQQRL